LSSPWRGAPSAQPPRLTHEGLRRLAGVLPWARNRDAPTHLPARCDLREWMPPVVDQEHLPTCTAAVVAGIAGYYDIRIRQRHFVASISFNYCTSRAITGDPARWGSKMQLALEAWRAFGLLEDRLWPTQPDHMGLHPARCCFPLARKNPEIESFQLDVGAMEPLHLNLIKHCLALGLPVTVDFPLHPSLMRSFRSRVIPVPRKGEPCVGRHVALLAGYDDDKEVKDDIYRCEPPTGGFLVRNSWGRRWADEGFVAAQR